MFRLKLFLLKPGFSKGRREVVMLTVPFKFASISSTWKTVYFEITLLIMSDYRVGIKVNLCIIVKANL